MSTTKDIVESIKKDISDLKTNVKETLLEFTELLDAIVADKSTVLVQVEKTSDLIADQSSSIGDLKYQIETVGSKVDAFSMNYAQSSVREGTAEKITKKQKKAKKAKTVKDSPKKSPDPEDKPIIDEKVIEVAIITEASEEEAPEEVAPKEEASEEEAPEHPLPEGEFENRKTMFYECFHTYFMDVLLGFAESTEHIQELFEKIKGGDDVDLTNTTEVTEFLCDMKLKKRERIAKSLWKYMNSDKETFGSLLKHVKETWKLVTSKK
uniref:Uncharacterized protein n=1 Tax=viral metagenome TaxID=1070528 RepID=A0A6C0IUK3_9ZZZZ